MTRLSAGIMAARDRYVLACGFVYVSLLLDPLFFFATRRAAARPSLLARRHLGRPQIRRARSRLPEALPHRRQSPLFLCLTLV